MRVAAHTIYEETVSDQLLADLGEYEFAASRGYGLGASVDGGAGSA
jgi:hypothetical protein